MSENTCKKQTEKEGEEIIEEGEDEGVKGVKFSRTNSNTIQLGGNGGVDIRGLEEIDLDLVTPCCIGNSDGFSVELKMRSTHFREKICICMDYECEHGEGENTTCTNTVDLDFGRFGRAEFCYVRVVKIDFVRCGIRTYYYSQDSGIFGEINHSNLNRLVICSRKVLDPSLGNYRLRTFSRIPRKRKSLSRVRCFVRVKGVNEEDEIVIELNNFKDLTIPYNPSINESIEYISESGIYPDFRKTLKERNLDPQHFLEDLMTRNELKNDIFLRSTIDDLSIPTTRLLLCLRSLYITKAMKFGGSEMEILSKTGEFPLDVEYMVMKSFEYFLRNRRLPEDLDIEILIKLYTWGYTTHQEKLVDCVRRTIYGMGEKVPELRLREIVLETGHLLFSGNRLNYPLFDSISRNWIDVMERFVKWGRRFAFSQGDMLFLVQKSHKELEKRRNREKIGKTVDLLERLLKRVSCLEEKVDMLMFSKKNDEKVEEEEENEGENEK